MKKLFAYFIDEPTYHQYKDIVEAGRMIHSMPARPKFLVTSFPEEPLIGAVDIWCVHMHFLPEGIPHGLMDREMYYEAVKGRMEAGDEVLFTMKERPPFAGSVAFQHRHEALSVQAGRNSASSQIQHCRHDVLESYRLGPSLSVFRPKGRRQAEQHWDPR